MDRLQISGAVLRTWLSPPFLFTPHISYHLSRRTVHAGDFLYTLQWTCDVTLTSWQRRPFWEKVVGPFIWILERQQ